MRRLGAIILGLFLLGGFFFINVISVYALEHHSEVSGKMSEVKIHEGNLEHTVSHKIQPHVSKQQKKNLLWWTVNFILLVALLVKYGRQPASDALRARQEAIESEYAELKKKRQEAEARYQEYEKKLATMEEEAQAIMEAFIRQGKREKERIIQEAHETAERIKQQAEFYIQQELEKARASLREEVANLSVQLAEQIIKEKITPEDQKRLVKEFIERVVH